MSFTIHEPRTLTRCALRQSEAAEELRKDRDQFVRNVKTTMRGGILKQKRYDNVLASMH